MSARGTKLIGSRLLPRVGKQTRRTELSVLAFIVVLPLVSSDVAMIERFGGYFLLAIFAISVDLIWGYGGMFTFGHATFFGGGGYLVGMLTTRGGWFLPLPFWLAMIAYVAGANLLARVMSYFVFS